MTATAIPKATMPRPGTKHPSLLPYIRTELRNSLLRIDTIIFVVIMPLAFYLMFGAMTEYGDIDAGNGTVSAVVMVNMAAFSTAIAATALSGTCATELTDGWGRQMALSPGGIRSYYLVKAGSAILLCLIPVTLIFAAGFITGAACDSPGIWAASYILCLLPAIPFALYGMAIGMWFPTQGAVGTATASVSVWAFLANIFMPIGGFLFTLAHWTPLYGAAMLAQRPILENMVVTATGPIDESLWIPVANLLTWTLLLGLVCMVSRRRVTLRR